MTRESGRPSKDKVKAGAPFAFFRVRLLVSLYFVISILSLACPAIAAEVKEPIYAIQVAAFKKVEYAEKEVGKLTRSGHHAFYSLETVKGKGKWYRVFVGRYASRSEARSVAKRLLRSGVISDYFIRIPRGEAGTHPRPEKAPAPEADASPPPLQKPLSREEASRQLARVSHLPLLINDITFKLDKGGKEVVRIHANRLFEPAVFAIEGDQPRFVIDIKDPIVPRTPPAKLLVNGRFIKRIRTHLQQVPRRLRIVLDLHPLEDYMVNQLFYRAENIYALEVAKERK